MHITEADMMIIPGQGYAAAPATLDPSKLPGVWESVELPHALPRQLLPVSSDDAALPATETVWYRLNMPPMAATLRQDYIYIPRLKTDGNITIYTDHLLLYQTHTNLFWNGWNIPTWLPLHETVDSSMPRHIYVRIVRPRDAGGGISSVWFGPEETIGWRYRMRYLMQVQLPFAGSSAFLAVGLFALLVWIKLRSQYSYLLLFCISVASFLRSMHYYVGEYKLPISDDWFSWLTINSAYWMMLLTHFFLNYIHRRPVVLMNYFLSGLTIFMCILTSPALISTIYAHGLTPLAYLALILTGLMVAGIGFYQSRGTNSREGVLLSAWVVAGTLLRTDDWLLQNNYVNIESIYFGPFSNISALLIFIYIIFLRYIAANENVVEFNVRLQTRLLEQEVELQNYHQRLEVITRRQTLDTERQRLIQDIHDGMGSSLVVALLAVTQGTADSPMVADILKDCIDDLKLTIDSMEPIQADLLLLLATLRFRLSPRLEDAGIKLRWEITDVPPLNWLDPRHALHILRIFQETFSNIIKHAQASEIRVETSDNEGRVKVVISDNGCGFSVEKGLLKQGKGLKNQLRRAAAIGCEVAWRSDTTGTSMTLTLPVVQKRPQVTH
ncbi:ATP-binding protein [Glaciimonas sp. GG7]